MKEVTRADEISTKLILKALKDQAFRKELMADSNATIEKELGIKIPAGIKVNVVEDTASTVHLVLPAVGSDGMSLSDADLEKIAGGAGSTRACWSFFSVVTGCI